MCSSAVDPNTDLYYAAAWGELQTVQQILDGGGYNIDYQKPDNGNTPLYIAAAWGYQEENKNMFYYEICQLLIDYRANVDIPNNQGKTPLYIASSWGHTNIVKLLIKNKADLNASMRAGRTPLHIAAISVPHVMNPIKMQPHYKYLACQLAKDYMEHVKNNPKVSRFLPNLQEDYQRLTGNSPANPNEDISDEIMDIIRFYNHFGTVTELVEAGAELNIRDDTQETPLVKAAYSGHLPMVQYLIEKGADMTVCNNRGRSIIDVATGNNHSHVVIYLNSLQV